MAAFLSFLVLLVIAVVASGILHYVLDFYATEGTASFLSKVVVAYFGASWGTPVFGAWFPGINFGEVYIFPAILGALALLIVAVDVAKMITGKN